MSTTQGVVESMLSLLVILLIFHAFYIKLPKKHIHNMLKGILISAIGLWLFLLGVQMGFLPYGRAIGETLGNFPHKWLAIPFGFLLGFITTRSEPAVRILCDQVEEASGGTISKSSIFFTICIGVAFIVALGMARIIYSIPLLWILIPGYMLVIVLLRFTQKQFIGIAFDAGGVATGPMANTYLLGLGLGLASSSNSENMMINSLGLVSLVALAPIISVMMMGVRARFSLNTRQRYL